MIWLLLWLLCCLLWYTADQIHKRSLCRNLLWSDNFHIKNACLIWGWKSVPQNEISGIVRVWTVFKILCFVTLMFLDGTGLNYEIWFWQILCEKCFIGCLEGSSNHCTCPTYTQMGLNESLKCPLQNNIKHYSQNIEICLTHEPIARHAPVSKMLFFSGGGLL